MNNYSFAPLRARTIPTKNRTSSKESPLTAKIREGKNFMIEAIELKQVSPTIYATAKRLGLKVSLRSIDNGVGVFFLKDGAVANVTHLPTKKAAKKATSKKAEAVKAA